MIFAKLRFLCFILLDFLFISFSFRRQYEETLIVVKTDAIGDYLLFRNYLEALKKSEFFSQKELILVCSSLWVDLSKKYDSQWVDRWVVVDRYQFLHSFVYRYSKLREVGKRKVHALINANLSRDFMISDVLSEAILAKKKYACQWDGMGQKSWQANLSSRYYTDFVFCAQGFEFERNRSFYERILQQPLNEVTLRLQAEENGTLDSQDKYVVVAPGAGDAYRCWPVSSFAITCQHIIDRIGIKVVITGSPQEMPLCQQLEKMIEREGMCENRCGDLPLSNIPTLIAGSEMVLGNETSLIHFAASLQKPGICISNGNHFGRFNPYPESIAKNIHYLYPFDIDTYEACVSKYYDGSREDISSVSPDSVINSAIKVLAA